MFDFAKFLFYNIKISDFIIFYFFKTNMKHKTWKIVMVAASFALLAVACQQKTREQPSTPTQPLTTQAVTTDQTRQAVITLATDLPSLITNAQAKIDQIPEKVCNSLNNYWFQGTGNVEECEAALEQRISDRRTKLTAAANTLRNLASSAGSNIQSVLVANQGVIRNFISTAQGQLLPYLQNYQYGSKLEDLIVKIQTGLGTASLVRSELQLIRESLNIELPNLIGKGPLGDYLSVIYANNQGAIIDLVSQFVITKCEAVSTPLGTQSATGKNGGKNRLADNLRIALQKVKNQSSGKIKTQSTVFSKPQKVVKLGGNQISLEKPDKEISLQPASNVPAISVDTFVDVSGVQATLTEIKDTLGEFALTHQARYHTAICNFLYPGDSYTSQREECKQILDERQQSRRDAAINALQTGHSAISTAVDNLKKALDSLAVVINEQADGTVITVFNEFISGIDGSKLQDAYQKWTYFRNSVSAVAGPKVQEAISKIETAFTIVSEATSAAMVYVGEEHPVKQALKSLLQTAIYQTEIEDTLVVVQQAVSGAIFQQPVKDLFNSIRVTIQNANVKDYFTGAYVKELVGTIQEGPVRNVLVTSFTKLLAECKGE